VRRNILLMWIKKVFVRCEEWRDGLVVSVLDQRPRGRGFESVGCGLSSSNRGPVVLCTLGLGLLNPPSSPSILYLSASAVAMFTWGAISSARPFFRPLVAEKTKNEIPMDMWLTKVTINGRWGVHDVCFLAISVVLLFLTFYMVINVT